jgi:hypothetical protein
MQYTMPINSKEALNRFEGLDDFTQAYIETALWCGLDEEEAIDRFGGTYAAAFDDLAPETIEEMEQACRAFQESAGDLITDDACVSCGLEYNAIGHAGFDFWLTRNRHGAGFWDGGWREPEASALAELARSFGEVNLYVGDDGLIYQL